MAPCGIGLCSASGFGFASRDRLFAAVDSETASGRFGGILGLACVDVNIRVLVGGRTSSYLLLVSILFGSPVTC